MLKFLRLFIVSFILFMSIDICSAQVIAYDKVNDNKERTILTGYINIYSIWTAGGSLRMSVTSVDDTLVYNLILGLNESKYTFDKGRKLLIKLKNEKVITLENCIEIGISDYEYRVTKYGTNYYTYPMYEISEAQIKEIIEQGVIKIRIETDIDTLDREIKKNKFSKAVSIFYDAIKKQLSTEVSLYDDF